MGEVGAVEKVEERGGGLGGGGALGFGLFSLVVNFALATSILFINFIS